MKKSIWIIGALALCLFTVLQLGIGIGRKLSKGAAVVKDSIQAIAVVNMDQGIELDEKAVNYGTEMVRFTGSNFYSASLEDARSGIERGEICGIYYHTFGFFRKCMEYQHGSPKKYSGVWD